MNEMDKIMAEMAELKRVDDAAEKNDVIKRTLSKLLTIDLMPLIVPS